MESSGCNNPFLTLEAISSTFVAETNHEDISSTFVTETNHEALDMSVDNSFNPFLSDVPIPQQFSYSPNISYNDGCDSMRLPAPSLNPFLCEDLTRDSLPYVASYNYSGLDSTMLMVKREAEALGFTDDRLRCDYVLRRLQMLNKPPEVSAPAVHIQSPKIRMTTWKSESETWEVFIHRFERYAADLKWEDSSKLLHLVSCLEGKALAIYRRIDGDKIATYNEVRKELEKAFSLTAEQLGLAFKSATKIPNETATQFAANLKEKFVNWYRKANNGLDMNTEGLLNHVIREQFIKSLPTQCKQQIKQHKLINIDEVARYAENYFEAYQNERKPEDKKSQAKPFVNNKKTPNNSSTDKDYRCRKCQTDKHWYFECTNKRAMITAAATSHIPSDLASKNKKAEASLQVTESSANKADQKSKHKGDK